MTLLKQWTHFISNFIFQIFLGFPKTPTSHQNWFLHPHVNRCCPWTLQHSNSNFSLQQIPTDNSCCLLIYRRRPFCFGSACNAFYSFSVQFIAIDSSCNFTNLPLVARFKSSAAVILLLLSCPSLSAFAGFLTIIFTIDDTCSAKAAASVQPKLHLTFTKPLAYSYTYTHIYNTYVYMYCGSLYVLYILLYWNYSLPSHLWALQASFLWPHNSISSDFTIHSFGIMHSKVWKSVKVQHTLVLNRLYVLHA